MRIRKTHDWNYDKPYEWGLETLTGIFFVKNKTFDGEENLFLGGLSLLILDAILGLMYQKKTHLQLHFCAIDLFKNFFSYLTILHKKVFIKKPKIPNWT